MAAGEAATSTFGAIFQINSAKRSVHVLALSINGKIKFLKKSQPGLKRKIFWNKYRS